MLNQAVQTASVRQVVSVSEDAGASENRNSYARLKALVREAGLFEPQGTYYAIKLAYTLGMFAAGMALFFLLTGWLRVLVVAPYLGFVGAQMGFLSHDLGHKQVFSSTRANN